MLCNDPMVLIDIDGIDREPMPGYSSTAVLEWCQGCVDPDTYSAEITSQLMILVSNVRGMGTFDLITLLFATTVISLHVVFELKGIELVDIAIRQAERNKEMGGPMDLGQFATPLKIINNIRRWIFLPSTVGSIPIMIGFKGGDALNICMNTIAILFLMEIDDVLFEYGVGERVRRRAMVAGRVELSKVEEEAIVRTKACHIVVVCASVLYSVRSLVNSEYGYAWAVAVQFMGFWLGGLIECASSTEMAGLQKITAMITVTCKCWLGFVVFGYIIQLSGHSF